MIRRAGKRNKFGAKKTPFMGEIYDSKMEAKYAQQLELRKQAIGPDRDRVVDVKRQVAIPLEVNGSLICHYRCDFVVTYADGHVQYEEVKGLSQPAWILKEKLFRALYPERRLVVVKTVR